MSNNGKKPALFICPYCPKRFYGRYDFAVAEKHIRESHQRREAGVRRKRDPFDFLLGGRRDLLLEEAAV